MKVIFAFAILFLGLNYSIQAQYNFKIEKRIEATSVKNQQNTGTCWSFSTASFFESELMRLGKGEHNISEMFVVYNIYVEKALNYVRRQGDAGFGQGSLGHDLSYVLKKYGMMPEQIYNGKNGMNSHNHSEMEALLKAHLEAVVKMKKPSPRWLEAYKAILDTYLGEIPEKFTYQKKEYTAKSFAQSMGVNPDDYVEITSYSHEPFYSEFVLQIPDNFSNGSYYNVPMEELEKITDNAVEKGYSLTWDCDVSEKGFSHRNGMAIIPNQSWKSMSKEAKEAAFKNPVEEKKISQELRQETYENYSTTDDHLMHIIGSAKDAKGNAYYLVKNSWGESNVFSGLLYASKAYFQLKTISIMVHKEAIPKDIAKKMGL